MGSACGIPKFADGEIVQNGENPRVNAPVGAALAPPCDGPFQAILDEVIRRGPDLATATARNGAKQESSAR